MASTIADGDYFIINGRSISTTANMGDTPVWRLYNPNNGDHLFTTSYNERLSLTKSGWHNEGLAFMVNSGDTSIPVYRVYNSNSGEHFFTQSATEKNYLVRIGWKNEGVAFYGAISSVGRAPVYRVYNPNSGFHFFTVNVAERDALVKLGWNNEGIAFYSGGTYCLNITNNRAVDLNNVDIYPYGATDAQIWRISTRTDGSRRILNRSCGKSIDVLGGYWDNGKHNGQYYNGQNVGIYHDDNAVNQKWSIVDSGHRQTFQGISYEEYWINLFGNPNGKIWNLEIYGADGNESLAPGKNVDISQHSGVSSDWNDRTWIFVPVPTFRPNGGIYSIRPYRNPTGYLDVDSGNNGANVSVYARRSGSNGQFWILTKGVGSNTYQVRNMGSGKMLDVANAKFANGTNVQIYTDNDSSAQQWTITSYGTTVYNSKQYEVVRFSIGSYPWCLDETAGYTYNKNNVTIYQNNDQENQRWILFPETVSDPSIPVPQNLYLNSAVGKTEGGDRAYQARLYPGWTCTDAWFYGDNHYEFRWRKRLCLCSSSTWTSWTDWTAWNPIGTTASGNKAWLTDGIDTSYNTSTYKNMEVEFGVRCVGTAEDYTSAIRGGAATATHKNIFVPTFTFGSAGFSFDGLRISYETDYPSGRCYLYLKKLEYQKSGSWISILNEEITYESLDNSGSIAIPIKYLNAAIPNGSKVRLTYQKGNDQMKQWTWRTWSDIVTVSRTAGNVTFDFKAYSYIRHTGVISIPTYANMGIWIVQNNTYFPLVKIDNPGHGIVKESNRTYYLMPYTWMYAGAIITASISSSDGDKWGMTSTYVNTYTLDHSRVHVWITEDGHIACLDCREGQTLDSKLNLQSDANTVVLNNREHEFVSFGKTIKNSFSADGAVMYSQQYGYTDCDVDDLTDLVSTHCLYRNPHGDLMSVAVTGVSVTTHHHYATVTVEMTEETR